MADVSNIINQYILYRKQSNKEKAQHIDPYPTENDHGSLRTMFPSKSESKQIVGNIAINVKYVPSTSDIPVNNLYYVESTKQYAINIAGIIIKGDLSNIVDYQTPNSARCEYGIDCRSFKKGQPCKYYHDPEDYLKLGFKCPESATRNFTVGSWLYSKNKRPKTYFTRHIGSKDSILDDLATLKKLQYREEISNREGQLIHDLLIYTKFQVLKYDKAINLFFGHLHKVDINAADLF